MSFFDSREPSFDNGLEKYEINEEITTEGICGEFIEPFCKVGCISNE